MAKSQTASGPHALKTRVKWIVGLFLVALVLGGGLIEFANLDIWGINMFDWLFHLVGIIVALIFGSLTLLLTWATVNKQRKLRKAAKAN